VKDFEIVVLRSASSVAILEISAGPGERGVLVLRALLGGDHLRADGVDRVGQAVGPLHERLLGGRAVRRLGEVRPRVPELRELRVDAVLARLGERELGAVERGGLGIPLVDVGVLRAELRVKELVADAAEALDVDAGAELSDRLRVGLGRERLGGGQRGFLSRVPLGGGIRDVVTCGVEHALLGQKAPQGGLHAEE